MQPASLYLVLIITLTPSHISFSPPSQTGAWSTSLFFSFFVFPECYSEYLGTEPTPSFLPSLMICHRLVSFGCVFSLTIDLLGRETPCKRHKLVLSLTVRVSASKLIKTRAYGVVPELVFFPFSSEVYMGNKTKSKENNIIIRRQSVKFTYRASNATNIIKKLLEIEKRDCV